MSDTVGYTKKRYRTSELGYPVIAAACNSGAWKNPERKRKWVQQLTVGQRDNARNNILPNAIRWARDGAPEYTWLSDDGKFVWERIRTLCEELMSKDRGGKQRWRP